MPKRPSKKPPRDSATQETLRRIEEARKNGARESQRIPKDGESMPNALAFISYSSKDKDFATRLSQALRSRNIDVWIDHEQIRFGDSVLGKISDGLKRCDAILLVVSTAFVNSSWCRSEYEPLLTREIDENRTVVIPLRLDDAELPVFLTAKRYADFRSGLADSILDELAESISISRSVTKRPARLLRLFF
jgi:TIR domain-containing protein